MRPLLLLSGANQLRSLQSCMVLKRKYAILSLGTLRVVVLRIIESLGLIITACGGGWLLEASGGAVAGGRDIAKLMPRWSMVGAIVHGTASLADIGARLPVQQGGLVAESR